MKITIEDEHTIVTIEDKTNSPTAEYAVNLCYHALIALSHNPIRIAEEMQAMAEDVLADENNPA